jgi:peptide/nickel transport system substrate-binding protein
MRCNYLARPMALLRAALPLCLAAILLAACGTANPPRPSPTPAGTAAPTAAETLGASAQPPTLTPAPGETPLPTPAPQVFTIGLAEPPGSLDPALAIDRSGLLITRHIYEGLFAYEAGGTRPVAALADRWEVSPDGLTWTFHLRAGVQFSDGMPFDAEAARLNFERWQQASPPGSYLFWRAIFGGFAGENGPDGEPLSLLASASAPAAQTLVLVLTRPYAGLPNVLAMPSFAMVSPAAFASAEAAGQLEAASAGTGPYQLAGISPEQIVQLERSPGYWGGPAGPDSLIFKPIADDRQRLLALVSNEIEVMSSVNPNDYVAVESEGAATRLVFDPALDIVYLGFNHARSPWDNADCRLAVAYALDKARYAAQVFPGDAQPAQSMLPPAVWGHNVAVERNVDLALARQYLETCQAAGVTLPAAISFYVPPIPRPYLPDPAALGAAIQADLAAIGLNVTIASPDWQTVWLPDVHSGRADLFLLGWTGISGDPDSFMCPLFCGAEGAFNTSDSGQPEPPDVELAALLAEARETADPAVRQTLYEQAQARIANVVPAVPLVHRQTSWAFQSGIEGFVPSPIDSVFFGLHRPAP